MNDAAAPIASSASSAFDRRTAFAGIGVRFVVPALLAALIHGVAILALMAGFSSERSTLRFDPAEAIEARLLTIESAAPERAAPEPAQQQRPAPTTPPRVAPDRTPTPRNDTPPAPQPRPAEDAAPEAAPEPEARVPETTRTSDFEDDALREALGDSFENALDAEAERLAESRAEAATGSFVGAIVARIERNWSRPPSARNDMEAELLIALVPTGELVGVEVVRSSGNDAFDRSAEIAVRRAAPFRVPDDPALFESRFRSLRILFKPEDLRD